VVKVFELIVANLEWLNHFIDAHFRKEVCVN